MNEAEKKEFMKVASPPLFWVGFTVFMVYIFGILIWVETFSPILPNQNLPGNSFFYLSVFSLLASVFWAIVSSRHVPYRFRTEMRNRMFILALITHLGLSFCLSISSDNAKEIVNQLVVKSKVDHQVIVTSTGCSQGGGRSGLHARGTTKCGIHVFDSTGKEWDLRTDHNFGGVIEGECLTFREKTGLLNAPFASKPLLGGALFPVKCSETLRKVSLTQRLLEDQRQRELSNGKN